jgi:23S rRNA pseudouridine2457 synthase
MPTLLFNKPYGVLSQFTDATRRPTLADYISIPGVYAAGRLDFRSEGLLLLSDDGSLIQRLTDPRFEHTKTYFAQVEGVLTADAVTRLNTDLLLPGIQTRRAVARLTDDPGFAPRDPPVRGYHPTAWLEIVLTEGKKHQVRRLTAAVGFPTLRLVRTAIGSLTLGSLLPGDWREVSAAELRRLHTELRSKFPSPPRRGKVK